VLKESNKKFFNGTCLAATARAGYGNVSLNIDYSVLGVLKQNAGPVMNRLSISLTISGLQVLILITKAFALVAIG
jgi:hypothetical protein